MVIKGILAVMMAVGLCAAIAAPAGADVFNMTGGLTSLEFVTVDDPGNPADSTGRGSVPYAYDIGKYEVTAGQYTEFLNAVAGDDPYLLYNPAMWDDEYGCKIERIGSAGSYTYSVATDRANRPVNYVSRHDAVRFANWLTNGQPSGPQGPATTESGSYNIVGFAEARRSFSARYVIPNTDEWYKAAYYDSNSGVYYDYPTGTDTPPGNSLIDPDPGNNSNYSSPIGSPYWTTEVGEFENSSSPCGTFDQGGNVAEWSDDLPLGIWSCTTRGGSWQDSVDWQSAPFNAAYYVYGSYTETPAFGFRTGEMLDPPPRWGSFTPDTVVLLVTQGSEVLAYIDLFTAYPYWLDGAAADVGGGAGIWKVNEEDYANIVEPQLDEGLNAIGFLPQYTPGTDPNSYWLLIEDLRVLRTGSDDDYEDLIIHVTEHPDYFELWAYRGYSIYDFQLADLHGNVFVDVGRQGNTGPFHVVPEPGTLSLLALGGLAVLRRKS